MSEKLSIICGTLTESLKNDANFVSYLTSSPPKAGFGDKKREREKKLSEIDLRVGIIHHRGESRTP
jgi:hypothetical protein